uniref:Mu-like prophage protein gp29 n=1 Tax=Candidatus Kentrum sp. UNK TaxID=2126344 RepID=A0A451ANW5_9GAMM|nr:MAG: Protein of unknown function (DUF935) [Candidatus Kentron sp. UNK]VFK73044.1 MAG: Protein of unknown function (DUF935) [Candidatus Kentron sp. UNK]
MKKPNGIYVSPTQFAEFGQGRRAAKSLTRQIATRDRRPDFNALGAFLPNPDPVLKAQGKDIKIYRELRTEPQVGGNIRRRKGAVKALEWGIEKKNAKRRAFSLIEGLFRDLPLKAIISEILDATLYGYQPMEILWEVAAGHLTPAAVIGKPPEWFHFDNENRLRFLTRESRREGELLPPYKFLLPRQEATYDNPYGFPDLSMVFWPTVFKKGGMTFWLDFSEKYGGAWAVGKLPRNTLEDETEAFADRLEEMIQTAVAVIPDDTSVEIKEAGGKGASADIFERLLMFCRSEVNFSPAGPKSSQRSQFHERQRQGRAGGDERHPRRR